MLKLENKTSMIHSKCNKHETSADNIRIFRAVFSEIKLSRQHHGKSWRIITFFPIIFEYQEEAVFKRTILLLFFSSFSFTLLNDTYVSIFIFI